MMIDKGYSMKKSIVFSLLWIVITGAVDVLAQESEVPSVLVTPDSVEVLVAANAKTKQPVAWFAAGELTNFLSRAFGRTVPLVTAPTPGRTAIVVGTNAWSAAAGVDITAGHKAVELMKRSDDIYLKFGADTFVYGLDKADEIREIRRKAIAANLKLIECPIRHLGTEEGYKIYTRLEEHLCRIGVEMRFNTMVTDIIIEDNVAKGVVTDKGETFYADHIVSGIGREGSEWFLGICRKHNIDTKVGTVDIGVRVECRDEVMDHLNRNLYEAKLVYYSQTFDDKVRTFCTNPSGEVATEYYENGLAVVNGHAYKSQEYKTNNTNFAVLVSKNFTKPFKTPIEFGKHIAQLSNMLCDGKILVQRFGDLRRGRRTTEERLTRNNLTPTLKDAVPGDLSLVLPHRIMTDIIEMIYALDKVSPGLASDETLLYGIEVKFYSNSVVVDTNFETSVKGLYSIGDGASVTRGLQQASANGLSVADSILLRLDNKA